MAGQSVEGLIGGYRFAMTNSPIPVDITLLAEVTDGR